jgi:hypothetical protein
MFRNDTFELKMENCLLKTRFMDLNLLCSVTQVQSSLLRFSGLEFYKVLYSSDPTQIPPCRRIKGSKLSNIGLLRF